MLVTPSFTSPSHQMRPLCLGGSLLVSLTHQIGWWITVSNLTSRPTNRSLYYISIDLHLLWCGHGSRLEEDGVPTLGQWGIQVSHSVLFKWSQVDSSLLREANWGEMQWQFFHYYLSKELQVMATRLIWPLIQEASAAAIVTTWLLLRAVWSPCDPND